MRENGVNSFSYESLSIYMWDVRFKEVFFKFAILLDCKGSCKGAKVIEVSSSKYRKSSDAQCVIFEKIGNFFEQFLG